MFKFITITTSLVKKSECVESSSYTLVNGNITLEKINCQYSDKRN